jgi:GTP pyrophosphokinase
MHNNAEFGVSAHFHYKNIEFSEKDNRLINILKDKTLIEKPKDISYVDYISVYTQTNQEIVIPKKSTLLDFAFSLHSDFAKYFDYAEINEKIIKDKSHLLKNGDKIKIIKSKKVTIKETDIDYLFNKRNKKKFNLILK